jgi:hypothetical protein
MREKEIQKGDDLATAVIIAQRAEQEERVQRMELERVAAGLEALYDLNADWLALHAHPNNAHRKETVALGARRSSTLASVPRPSEHTKSHAHSFHPFLHAAGDTSVPFCTVPYHCHKVILLHPSVPYRTIVTTRA